MIQKFDIYKHPQIYDDQYWWKKDDIEFYKQILPSGSKVLELGSGTGRLAIPLIKNNIDYYGLDTSKEFIKYAHETVCNINNQKIFINQDMRSFSIKEKFDFIFIAFNTFLHLLTNKDALECLKSVKKHLSMDGKFILDIVVPKPEFLNRKKDKQLLLMDFKDREVNDLVEIYEKCEYDSESEICSIEWNYKYKTNIDFNKVFKYQMRMYHPDTINRILIDSGFFIDNLFGDYQLNKFSENSDLQIYIAQ